MIEGREGRCQASGRIGPVAVTLTVKDEEHSIRQLLDRLFAQALRPAEVLIVDGGSRDQTVEVIQSYIDRGYPIRLIVAPGACRGRGRNLAIVASRFELIALIDGGCFPEPTWLERLVAQLATLPPKDAIFGVVYPITGDLFTECVSTASISAVAIPGGGRAISYSVASLLLRRSVWDRVGGFVEGVRTGEDLIFVQRIRNGEFAVSMAPGAIVYWEIPRTLRGTFRRFADNSYYGLEAGLGHTWHYRTFLHYTVALLLVTLGLSYSWWWFVLLAGLFVARVIKTILRNEKEKRGLQAFFPLRLVLVGFIMLAVDLATLYGTLRWLWASWAARPAGTPTPR